MSEPDRAYLFDTTAILALLRPQPDPAYLRWLARVPREHQYTSAVVVAELFAAAHRQRAVAPSAQADPVAELARRLLPALTALPFDSEVAATFGLLAAVSTPSP
ncbi:MAG: PIN domain-containing protein, partial [Gemmatimonadota bacterium]